MTVTLCCDQRFIARQCLLTSVDLESVFAVTQDSTTGKDYDHNVFLGRACEFRRQGYRGCGVMPRVACVSQFASRSTFKPCCRVFLCWHSASRPLQWRWLNNIVAALALQVMPSPLQWRQNLTTATRTIMSSTAVFNSSNP